MLGELPLPAVGIKMKETLMLVIDTLVEQDRAQEAQIYFSTPNDILRYLWYKKTGFLQIIEPKTIIRKQVETTHIYVEFWIKVVRQLKRSVRS